MRLLKFGELTLEDKGVRYMTNFTNMVTATTRLPGLDGAFDEYGDTASPSEVGNIRYEMMLVEANPNEMQRKRDAIRSMAGLGVQRLYVEPIDPLDTVRWCWARVNSIDMPDDVRQLSRTQIPITINFQAAYPRWFTLGTSEAIWGGGHTWGASSARKTQWGGGVGVRQAVSGLTTNFTLTNNGSADAIPVIFISVATGQGVVNPITIIRLIDGVAVDQLTFASSLGANETIRLDCRAKLVQRQGTDAYSLLTALTPDWLRLRPGANSMRVTMGGVSDACTVRFKFADTWY